MFGWWQRWRSRREAQTAHDQPIPADLWGTTVARYPFIANRPADELEHLREMARIFLLRKRFTGVHGLEVTDEMAIAVAAQACLPVLHLGLDVYDGFVGIVLHPSQAIARRQRMDDTGVVHEYEEWLAGEAMQGGPMMLSWPDVRDAGLFCAEGYNVVIHECAHILDMQDGAADGCPPWPDAKLGHAWHASASRAWSELLHQINEGLRPWLDEYAAHGPEEFFAVLVESFFVSPHEFQQVYPELHFLFVQYFRQDPASYPAFSLPKPKSQL